MIAALFATLGCHYVDSLIVCDLFGRYLAVQTGPSTKDNKNIAGRKVEVLLVLTLFKY